MFVSHQLHVLFLTMLNVEIVPIPSFRSIAIKILIWFSRREKENHNHQIAATPTVSSAVSMPMKLFSLADSGLTFVFPAALLAPPEVLELPVAEAVPAVLEVMLPLGMPEGKPGDTPA
jgi:hypothetical protein